MAKRTDTKSKRLVILDSHAILHRAYHALPDLSSSAGEPTGALYGLTTILLKMLQDLKPDYIVAARDLPGKTHRHKAFEAYKATRMKADDALIAQLQRAPIVFKAFGIPLYEAPGFEADDVVGTIVKKVSGKKGLSVIIASGDMDTLQLVQTQVKVYTMRKGITDTVLYDEDAVKARYGFGPEHVVDYKALRGDPSDNIPGIRGIGEKTASELIQKFGSIEDMYKTLTKKPKAFERAGVRARIAELVRDGEKDARFSKELATIQCDVPITFELPKKTWHLEDNAEGIMQLCDVLEFRSLRERVRTLVGGVETAAAERLPALEAHKLDPQALKEACIALWLLHSDTSNPTLEDMLGYAHTDSFEAAREKLFADLKTTGRLQDVFDGIEKPLIPVTERMNQYGVYVDVKKMKKLDTEYTKTLGELADVIYKAAGHEFNINSPKQLGTVLFDELRIGEGGRYKKTATGARTTKESELVKLAEGNPIVADVLSYREMQKLLGTYIQKMPALVDRESRLHAQFVQAGTTTGRMSSQDPNLQNIPVASDAGRRIREAFTAPKGRRIASLDYSQIELRIAAGLSGDAKLIEVFQSGSDVHTAVASEVFGVSPAKVDKEMRRRAKVINFGILYGMGANALRANLGDTVSRDEAQHYLDEYFSTYAGLKRFVDDTIASAARLGYTETLFGRRRYFSGFKSSLPGLRAQAERMARNAPIQGTQADIVKLAMIDADRVLEQSGWREKASLVMQVHDELVYEIDADMAENIARAIREKMETVIGAEKLHGVPLIAEIAIGASWGEAEKIAR